MLANAEINPDEAITKILRAIAADNAVGGTPEETGIYIIGHWNFNYMIANMKEEYPRFEDPYHCYGVCDSIEQWKRHYARPIEDANRRFCVAFVEIRREDQSSEGGWRAHKWGPYIGTQDMQHEYLYDDKHIDKLYTYHVYELTA